MASIRTSLAFNVQRSTEHQVLITLPVRLLMDVTDKASIRRAVSHVEAKDGKLDILVNKYGQPLTFLIFK
jgi:NAD(P)-dependent dehydrogenase (short-subunit alcohol dehydrogenase family)